MLDSYTLLKAMNGIHDEHISLAMVFLGYDEAGRRRRRRLVWRTVLIAAAVAGLLGAAAYAISGIIHSTGTYPMDNTGEYRSLGELPGIEKTVGYDITPPESFANGYVFEKISVKGEAAFDENNDVLVGFYGVNIEYAKAGAQNIVLSLAPVLELPTAGEHPEPTETRKLDGVEVRYFRDHYKIVPEDYEKTEADLMAEAAGHFYITYGPGTAEEHDYEFAAFVLNGVEYVLMDANGDGEEALFQMASEVIAAQH